MNEKLILLPQNTKAKNSKKNGSLFLLVHEFCAYTTNFMAIFRQLTAGEIVPEASQTPNCSTHRL